MRRRHGPHQNGDGIQRQYPDRNPATGPPGDGNLDQDGSRNGLRQVIGGVGGCEEAQPTPVTTLFALALPDLATP
jgi:hypothetical protein